MLDMDTSAMLKDYDKFRCYRIINHHLLAKMHNNLTKLFSFSYDIYIINVGTCPKKRGKIFP
jgi:hypothetical protein